jgi:hypothetical protein
VFNDYFYPTNGTADWPIGEETVTYDGDRSADEVLNITIGAIIAALGFAALVAFFLECACGMKAEYAEINGDFKEDVKEMKWDQPNSQQPDNTLKGEKDSTDPLNESSISGQRDPLNESVISKESKKSDRSLHYATRRGSSHNYNPSAIN